MTYDEWKARAAASPLYLKVNSVMDGVLRSCWNAAAAAGDDPTAAEYRLKDRRLWDLSALMFASRMNHSWQTCGGGPSLAPATAAQCIEEASLFLKAFDDR